MLLSCIVITGSKVKGLEKIMRRGDWTFEGSSFFESWRNREFVQ